MVITHRCWNLIPKSQSQEEAKGENFYELNREDTNFSN